MRQEYEKFRVLKQKRIESARNAAQARYEGTNASRMRNECDSDASRTRHESISSSYSNIEKEENISPDSVAQLFCEFWRAYPRKEVPNKARKAFEKLKPDRQLLATILGWLATAKLSKQWHAEEFIPLPATFLSQKYWEGDPPPQAAQKSDSVGLTCAEPAREYCCDSCEGTGRLVVIFSNETARRARSQGVLPGHLHEKN